MEDWQEEDVWAVMWGQKESSSRSSPPPRRRAAVTRKVSQARRSAAVVIRRLGEEESVERQEQKLEEEPGMVPPHQWIARNTEKKEIYSFSMCEGAGRTLKGRDLSRVRTAVLTRTGFLEPSSR